MRIVQIVGVACGLMLAFGFLGSTMHRAVGQAAGEKNATSDPISDAQKSDAMAIFASQCGWCHGDYGMKPGSKAPQLAGTQMTEHEVEQRIRNGKPGYMPSFRKSLDDQQIILMAKYIKSLVPQN